ncbi:MAG: IS5 family transposase ISAcma43 [Chroococcidiopsis sp. SAG 2025]|uniref:IS5 family transposase n=1 Tax=Chroococcidiopsis sp. SAG 2025 TaxID=171389 RepID=UPI0029370A08|nr:IS5 family transposase [Chroococcidiopsis sp. SAG 2025]MDV2996869.1 IS5 family transposase ISAcma43 [Chroococcidiopsis sp. SAG 2025]
MIKAYSSNLTLAQFELIESLIPAAKPGGRPRKVDMWAILNAIFYVVVQGCKWRDIPSDFPAWQTVYTYFRNWRKQGIWMAIHDRLRNWVRADNARPISPTEAIIDSQSVATATMVHESVGFDKAKHIKGRKRHTAVDTLGLVLRVIVTTASLPEREGGKQVLQKVDQMGDAVARLYLIWVDGGYSGNPFLEWVMNTFRWVVQVVLRPEQTKGFVVLKKLGSVERTFGWLHWYRRLSKDYERLPENSEAMIYISMIRLMLRRLA